LHTATKMKKEKQLELSIELPQGITAKVEGSVLSVKGAHGEVKRTINHPLLNVAIAGNMVNLSAKRNTQREVKLIYAFRAHILNMTRGAANGHLYELKICASHFPMNVSVAKDKFIVKNFLGEKYPRTMQISQGVEVKVEAEKITIMSTDKEKAGMTASSIEELMKRPGFDKRIFQDGIYITKKDGKELH
jgi:large subunit ribosomal protein L6